MKCEYCGEDLERLRSHVRLKHPEHSHPEVPTPRELDIVNLIKEGFSNKLAAGSLGISPQTVKNQVTTLMKRLGAHDRTHVVYICLKKGYIE